MFIKHLATFLQNHGNTVTIIETFKKGIWSDKFTEEGFAVKPILPNLLMSSSHHAKIIGKFLCNFDAVILNDAPLAQSALGLLPNDSVAIPVLHMHLTSMVENAAANSSNWDKLVAVSPYGMLAAFQYGVAENKTLCIPNGVDVSNVWQKKDQAFKKAEPLKIVYVGRIENEQKGVLLLPGIITEVLKKTNNINLAVVGDGPDLTTLQKMIADNGLERYVTFYGALPNEKTIEILKASDVLIMPSRFEGLPIVLLEAMSFGVVPVVTRLIGRTDFALRHGENGFLVDVDDTAGFANKLELLTGDRSLLKKCSFEAWQTAFERFRSDVTGAAYLSLIREFKSQREKEKYPGRTGKIEISLLGDFPALPQVMVRPVRKLMRLLGIFKEPARKPLFFEVNNGDLG